jgi:hypothetical protein
MHEHNGHAHDDGIICGGCRFKAALTEHLQKAAGRNDRVWHDTTGELMELAAGCVMSLTALRMQRVSGNGDPRENAAMAGAVISRLGGVIDELWHELVGDDDDDGDE